MLLEQKFSQFFKDKYITNNGTVASMLRIVCFTVKYHLTCQKKKKDFVSEKKLRIYKNVIELKNNLNTLHKAIKLERVKNKH